MEETGSSGNHKATGDSAATETAGGPISPDAISRAQQSLGGGDLPPPGAGPAEDGAGTTPDPSADPAASSDPSVGGPASRAPTDPDRTQECIGLATAAIGAIPPTLRIFDVADVDLTAQEEKQLGEVWGKVLRWHYEVKEGTKTGDHVKAAAVSMEIGKRKLTQIESDQSSDGSSHHVGSRSNGKRQDDLD
jgi:hypothetical protein